MKHMKIRARDFLALTEDQIWEYEDAEKVTIEFDDGKLSLGEVINVKIGGKIQPLDYNPMAATRMSWYYWNIQREFPDAPLLKHHHIGERIYTSGTHLDILTDVYFDTLDKFRANNWAPRTERWMWLLMKNVMSVYNAYAARLGGYVAGVSVIDFHEVVKHPKVKAVNDALMKKRVVTYEDIEKTHNAVMEVLTDPNAFTNNGVNNAIVRNIVSAGQVLQCVSARGFVEDIDSNIFREPIRSGFYHGLYKMADYAKESRSASKAAFYQNRHMGNSEYLNRSIQLSAATLKNCEYGDCGNERTSFFNIETRVDKEALLGKWYKDKKDSKTWKVVRPESDLIGKGIYIRSLFGCTHGDEYTVCSSCVGDMADSFIRGTSIGWVAGAGVFGRGGQLLLSVKHNDGSVSATAVDLDPFVGAYVRATDDPQYLKLSEQLKDKHPALIVRRKDFGSLHHVLQVEDVRKLMPSNLATMEVVKFETQDSEGLLIAPINLDAIAHKAAFTFEALEYIQKHAWTLTEKNEARIDLSHWDFKKPFFLLPLKHHSMVEQLGGMKRAVLGSQETRKGAAWRLMDFDNPESATTFLHEIVTPKMPGTNYALLEIIVASTLARDPDNRDFRLPNPLYTGKFATHRDIMFNRSLGPMMAFERHHQFFMDPNSYLNKNRGQSPMDMVLKHELAADIPPIGPE